MPDREPAVGRDSDPGLRELVDEFTADLESVDAYYRFAFHAPDLGRRQRFFREWSDRLDSLDFDSLGAVARVDWHVFRAWLRTAEARTGRQLDRLAECDSVLPFRRDLAELVSHRRDWGDLPAEEAARRLQCAAEAACTAAPGEGAGDGPSSLPASRPVVLNRALGLVESLREPLETWFSYREGFDPAFSWWARGPFQALREALDGFQERLRSDHLGVANDGELPPVGDPLGRDELERELSNEFIAASPEELIAAANREWDWCRGQARIAAAELGCKSYREAVDKISANTCVPGEQPGLVRRFAEEAIAFVRSRDLVTVPALCEETWEMEMMPPEKQKVNPFFLGGRTIVVSYPAESMSHPDKLMSLRGNNRHFARATVQHELVPGHHLQFFHQDRLRRYRRVFQTPFLVEGWALHWEMLLWKLGFPESPGDRLGMLFWRIHRCARVVFSLRFHLGEISADDAVTMLVDEVGHERRNAMAEVRRSVGELYPPLYQAAYLVGGLQMHGLWERMVRERGWSQKRFHDAVLAENSIPIPLIAAALSGEAPGAEFPGWKPNEYS